MCKKRGYSRQGALYAIVSATTTKLNGKNKSDKVPVRSYYCKWCKKYHLTSKSQFDIKKGTWHGSQNTTYGRL